MYNKYFRVFLSFLFALWQYNTLLANREDFIYEESKKIDNNTDKYSYQRFKDALLECFIQISKDENAAIKNINIYFKNLIPQIKLSSSVLYRNVFRKTSTKENYSLLSDSLIKSIIVEFSNTIKEVTKSKIIVNKEILKVFAEELSTISLIMFFQNHYNLENQTIKDYIERWFKLQKRKELTHNTIINLIKKKREIHNLHLNDIEKEREMLESTKEHKIMKNMFKNVIERCPSDDNERYSQFSEGTYERKSAKIIYFAKNLSLIDTFIYYSSYNFDLSKEEINLLISYGNQEKIKVLDNLQYNSSDSLKYSGLLI